MPVKPTTSKFARLSPYVRGIIFGLYLAGLPLNEILEQVVKPDGSSPQKQTVCNTIRMCEKNGGFHWDGGAAKCHPGGGTRVTSSKLDRQVVKAVFKHRGSAKVTVKFIQKTITAARAVSRRTIARRLAEAGLAWLRRRRKSLILAEHKAARIEWALWVLGRTAATLSRWIYTDGTVFYLARDSMELLQGSRAALGTHVWRQADGSDSLYEDCVGPSFYYKAQGKCVRIWGLLLQGFLFFFVLPAGAVMNREWYEYIIDNKFPAWIEYVFGRNVQTFLVQDHERCLWTDEAAAAMEEQNVVRLDFPKCSQDLNPIETAWREVRVRLADTEPKTFEDRATFLIRSRQAVAWVNHNRADYLKKVCTSQKEWAKDVLKARGARTSH